jgi:hypothetical protein
MRAPGFAAAGPRHRARRASVVPWLPRPCVASAQPPAREPARPPIQRRGQHPARVGSSVRRRGGALDALGQYGHANSSAACWGPLGAHGVCSGQFEGVWAGELPRQDARYQRVCRPLPGHHDPPACTPVHARPRPMPACSLTPCTCSHACTPRLCRHAAQALSQTAPCDLPAPPPAACTQVCCQPR